MENKTLVTSQIYWMINVFEIENSLNVPAMVKSSLENYKDLPPATRGEYLKKIKMLSVNQDPIIKFKP